MRKEVLIAIVIGFSLGLIITYGLWTANKAFQKTSPPAPAENQEKISPTPSLLIPLIITSPLDNSLSSQEKIKVTGQTSPQATVVVLWPEGEKIIEADNEGKFDTEISLVGGNNEITITAYDQQENETSKILTVVYSTAEI